MNITIPSYSTGTKGITTQCFEWCQQAHFTNNINGLIEGHVLLAISLLLLLVAYIFQSHWEGSKTFLNYDDDKLCYWQNFCLSGSLIFGIAYFLWLLLVYL